MFGLDGIDGRSGILGTFTCDPGRLKEKTKLVSTAQQKNPKSQNSAEAFSFQPKLLAIYFHSGRLETIYTSYAVSHMFITTPYPIHST